MSVLVRSFSAMIVDHPALGEMAAIHGRIERSLHAAIKGGREFKGDLGRIFHQRFDISAKMLDCIHRQLQAKLKSTSERAKVQAEEIGVQIKTKQEQIAKAEKAIANARKKPDEPTSALRRRLHQHKRRLGILGAKLVEAKRQIDDPRLCFGSMKLFNAQHHRKENSYANHGEWLKDWRHARSSQFFVEGDARFAGGNQHARLAPHEDGSFDLELRLPEALAHLAERTCKVSGRNVRCITLKGLRFAHGTKEICETLAKWDEAKAQAAIEAAQRAKIRKQLKEGSEQQVAEQKAERPKGQALSFRFMRDERGRGWTVAAIIHQEFVDGVADFSAGAIGIDLNADHVALTYADACGNPSMTKRIDLVTYGKTKTQREDMIKKAAAEIVKVAAKLGVPVVAETLDFKRKKAELTSADGKKHARMLTSFAFSAFATALQRACVRRSVRLVLVNPAYTSLIGRVKFAPRYGLSVHAAAALSIARRGMDLSERLPAGERIELRLADGDHVALDRPARIGRRHVWSSWGRLHRGLSTVLAERSRARLRARSDGAKDQKKVSGVIRTGRGLSAALSRAGWCDPPAQRGHRLDFAVPGDPERRLPKAGDA